MVTEQSQRRQSRTPEAPLENGQKAPDFELKRTPDQTIALSSLLGKPVVLVFYPADWSPVCGDELALYNELHEEWEKHDAQLVGISVDGAWCHIAYAKERRLRFPLLADFEPKGEIAKQYGVYVHEEGVAARAIFVIDREGMIAWSEVVPLGINPGADGILEALENLDRDQPGPDTGERPREEAAHV